ncbi:FecR family protein [Brevundimonas sp.]|uniref:FecR family protein n=1 Tax=Brevundimonas sp. TaxID=1871086 RepID=UPI00356B607A
MSARETADQIGEDAARWVMRIDREGHTPQVEQELKVWVSQDPRRAGALLMAEASWGMLDDLGQPQHQTDHKRGAGRPTLTRRTLWTGAGGAIAACAGAASLFILLNQGQVYVTEVGEIRRVPLADRSTMAVNTASQIKVEYSDARRAVVVDSGEAWFQVAKDKTRPFVVSAGDVHVEAVGTAFSVRRREAGADVMVTEGVVQVWVGDSRANAVFVTAGSAIYAANTALIRLEPEMPAPTIERKLAWRSGRLDLQGETLQAAVDEFNRYNATPIVVTDPALAQERLYGVFRLDDASGFAQTAAVTLDATISVEGNRILLTRPD